MILKKEDMYQSLLNEARRLTNLDKKTKLERFAKLSEEQGELAAALLSDLGAPTCGYKDLGTDDVVEEACDVLVTCFSILHHYEASDVEIGAMLKRKLAKWEALIEAEST